MTVMHPAVITGARTRCPECENDAPVTVRAKIRAHNRWPGGPNCAGGGMDIDNLKEVASG